MQYQVLARKWRPKNFTEVAGQEHIIRALTNALTQQRLHHAYLFSGTRGVGKTTIARILAKCFNCETGITAIPCGKCDTCIEIDSGRSIDLIEVDAASRTKVEDTRDLLDNVQYLPSKSRYKIYIIDEVHMLSGHSFNALLKTLEEPPEHVKFLLATTDPQKLPVTVLSRCLQFNLKALSPELIQKQLDHILTQEKIAFEDTALYQLALNANGSVRDALSLLDQAISFGHNQVNAADVKIMLSSVDTIKILELIEALVANNTNMILKITNELAELAVDFIGIINEILEIFHQITIAQLIPNANPGNWQHPDLINKLATRLNPEEVQLYYQIGLIGKRDLFLAPSPKSGFEMIILRMLAFRPETSTASLLTEKRTASTAPTTADQHNDTKPHYPTPYDSSGSKQSVEQISSNMQNSDPTEPNNTKTQTAAAPANITVEEIINILPNLAITGPTQALLQHCVVTNITNNIVEILLEPNQLPLLNKKHEERISTAFSNHFNTKITANLKVGTTNMNTPANTKKQQDSQKQYQASQSIVNDNRIKDLINKFDAKIIDSSINSLDFS